jgi:hypothetical protein
LKLYNRTTIYVSKTKIKTLFITSGLNLNTFDKRKQFDKLTKKKQQSIENIMNFINHRYATNSSDPNVIKLQQLSKTTKKTFRITLGKNKQEQKRLSLMNNILEKNYNYEDNNWLRNFIETRRNLNQIKKNVTPKYTYENANKNDEKDVSRKENENSVSRSNSTLSLSSVYSLESSSTSEQKQATGRQIFRLNHDQNKQFKSSINEYNHKKGDHEFSISKLPINEKYNNEFSTDYIHLTSTPYPYQSFSITKNNLTSTKPRAQTCTFPFSNIRSYTSMVNAYNDKDFNDLKKFRLKSSLETRSLSTVVKTSMNKTDAKDKQTPEINITPINLDLLDANYDLIKNKSIRRPKKNIASTFEVLNKLKTLNKNLKDCKEQQKVNFQFNDRNTRYGQEVKSGKTKHLRQLKLISRFEALKL